MLKQRNYLLTRIIPACLLLLLIQATSPVYAGMIDVSVKNARIRLLPGDLPLAGYCDLLNNGWSSITLTGVSSPAFESVMLHRSVEKDGQSRMQPVKSLVLQPGHAAHFAPGGYHLMLMHRKGHLDIGQSVPITFQFSDGHKIETQFTINAANTQ